MLEEKQVKRIKFGLLSPEIVRKMSVAKIMTADTYDDEGYPIDRGLMDPRLGVIDPGLKCKTCNQKFGRCSGHFGHIELARPVIHIGYVRDMYMFLKATCRECGRIILSEKELETAGQKLEEAESINGDESPVIKKIVKEANKKKRSSRSNKCPHCGAKFGWTEKRFRFT
jgi:DNA-directed RNA polymerase subunit A'